ncbi:pilus assembly protein TadG-related protein [Ensifer aridi]|uniref:vWA domain-containing protein n=1 Tax=Ensifer aridi TaxID=1708715 RepID=UPI00358FC13E
MGKRSTVSRSLAAMLQDRGGNFAMMTALLAPLLLAAGGVSIDMANMLMTKNQLQDATDAAALAAASALVSNVRPDAEEAKAIARKFLKAQMAASNAADLPGAGDESATEGTDAASRPEWDDVNTSEVNITETPNGTKGKSFKVSIVNKHLLQFNAMTRLLGQESIELETRATAESATETRNAISMYLVLDRSGSMAWKTTTVDKTRTRCPNYTSSNWWQYPNLAATSPCYIDKISTLKTAVNDMFAPLVLADPGQEYMRAGAVSYNDKQDPATKLNWGSPTAGTYVKALKAIGGTDSSSAFKTAYEKLTAKDSAGANLEDKAHAVKNGQIPEKYIVFMTDGENTHFNGRPDNLSSDAMTKSYCDKAKTAGIQVFAVAFMAPQRGKDLLQYCATSSEHYLEAEDAEELVAEFKKIGEKAAAMASRLTK